MVASTFRKLAVCLGGLALIPGAAIASPLALSTPAEGGDAPLIAYDPALGTTYVAWTAKPDNTGIDLCILAADATGCTGGVPTLLTDSQYPTGLSVPFLGNLNVLPNGDVVVLGVTPSSGSVAWESAPGGATFESGNEGIQNGGLPISAIEDYYNGGDSVALSNTDLGVLQLDAHGDEFSDAPISGGAPTPPAMTSSTQFSSPPGADDDAAGIAAEPTPGVAGEETVVTTGENNNEGSQGTPTGCINQYATGFAVRVGTINGTSNASGTLNGETPASSLLACAAEAPELASGGTDGIGVLEEEGPSVSGAGSDLTMDWRPFDATATGGAFGPPVELQDLTSHVLVDVNLLAVVDDRGTGVYADWTDEQGLVVDYSPNGGANWYPPVTVPSVENSSMESLTQGNPVIEGIGNGIFELAYDNSLGTGNQDFLQVLNYADLLPVTPVTVATAQTSGTSTGPNVTIPAGTVGESDKATIQGADSATATGTVTYNLYPTSDCSGSSEFTASEAVVDGAATSSPGVTLPLQPGTYYWKDAYSGDAATLANAGGNQPGTSPCGGEKLTVGDGATAPTTATSTSSTISLTVTCTAACTVTITITVPGGSAADIARVSNKTKKPITIATGKFSLKKGGKHTLRLKYTSKGKSLLAKDHGKLKTTLLLSDKTAHGTFKSSKTLKITKKK